MNTVVIQGVTYQSSQLPLTVVIEATGEGQEIAQGIFDPAKGYTAIELQLYAFGFNPVGELMMTTPSICRKHNS